MLSSIFSSKEVSHRSIKIKWWLTWLLVLIICLGGLGSYELFLKRKGFVPSIENNNNLWSWYREKVNNNLKSLTIIGASRSQLDINIPYLKKRLQQYDVTQLSVNGNYPMATLKALANDEDFKGTLIVSLNAQALEPVYFDMQLPQNEYFANKSTTYKSFDAYLTAIFKSKLRVLHPLLGLQQVVEFYGINKTFKPVLYTTANLAQSVSANYSLTNSENLYNHFVTQKEKNYREEVPTPADDWLKYVDLLIDYTQAIESRGGHVLLIRFPTFRGHWQLDEKFYPRSQYWDKIAQQPSLKTIHFNDVKGLNLFNSPDSSHLDQKDSVKFTQILFDELITRQYIK
jgi:hypothetical protein